MQIYKYYAESQQLKSKMIKNRVYQYDSFDQ